MRTTKAQTHLAAEETKIRDQIAAVNAQCKALQLRLELIIDLRKMLAEPAKKAGAKKGRGTVGAATTPEDGATTVTT